MFSFWCKEKILFLQWQQLLNILKIHPKWLFICKLGWMADGYSSQSNLEQALDLKDHMSLVT